MKIKQKIMITLAVFCSVFLIACGKDSVNPDAGKTTAGTTAGTSSQTAAATTPATSPATGTNEKPEEKDVPIYSINDDSLYKEDTNATVTCEDGKITAEGIVNAVVEDFKNHSIEIGVDSVKEKGKTVYGSFKYGTARLAYVGAGVESTILDCISQSLLDNLDSCSRVVFQAEGQAYCSGHYEFGEDEAYIEK